jgi:hypothetical protein
MNDLWGLSYKEFHSGLSKMNGNCDFKGLALLYVDSKLL